MPDRNPFRVEAAGPDDLPVIAALQTASWRAAYRGILADEALGRPLDDWLGAKWKPEALASRHVPVARHARAIAGFAACDPCGPEGAGLDNPHVRRGLKCRDIGHAAMAAIAARAPGDQLYLDVLAANHPARGVYRACGGSEDPVFEDRPLGGTVPALRLRWGDAGALSRRLRRSDP